MKKYTSLVYLALVCTILVINVSSAFTQCPLTTDQVDIQVLNQYTIPCLQKALRNGWQTIIDHLVKQKQPQYQEQFISVIQQQLKRLQILEEDIVLGTSQTEPILKWGQNQTHVFITFKLSHRWDSPPCLYTQSQQSRLQTNAFFYNNVCVVSHQKVNFKVNLNFYQSVMLSMKGNDRKKGKVQESNQQFQQKQQKTSQQQQNQQISDVHANYTDYQFDVKKDGVGQYSTILLKQVPKIWLFLTKQQKNYQTWREISERFQNDFREYQKSLATYKMVQRQRQSAQAPSKPAPMNTSSQL